MTESAADRPSPKRKRRPAFLEPPNRTAVLKTPEMRQVQGLVILLVLLGAFFLMFGHKTPHVLSKVFRSKAAEAPSSPDAIPITINPALVLASQPAAIQGAFDDVMDGADFAETTGWIQALKQLRDASPEEIHAKVIGPLEHDKAVEGPALLRGKYVRVSGVVADVETIKVHDESLGLSEVWRLYLTDLGDRRMVVDLATPVPHSPELNLRHDKVDIDAVFYRTVGYEANKGGRLVIPYLLGRNLVIDRDARAPFLPPEVVGPLAVVACVLIFGAVFLYSRRALKRKVTMAPAGFKEMFERKLREERAKQPRPADPARPTGPTEPTNKTDSAN